VPRIAYFGLPLGALLLHRDGFSPALAVLSPTEAPGRRRLRALLEGRLVDAQDERDAQALEEDVDRRLALLAPDLIVSWYFTRRLPARWLDAAPLGAIGVHPSLLPRHRGPNPFFWAIDSGDPDTGVTVHRLVEEYDEGDVLFTESVPIGERNAWQLARALDRPSLRLLRSAVRAIVEGRAPARVPQDHGQATWAPEPSGEELRADWRWPTARVLRRIRALAPVPGLALSIRGVELFVMEAAAAADYPLALEPGEAGVTAAGLVVRTADGAILLERAALVDPLSEEPVEIGCRAIAERVAAAQAAGG
jgi:methionyl-tRNA formyltransferase